MGKEGIIVNTEKSVENQKDMALKRKRKIVTSDILQTCSEEMEQAITEQY